MAKGLPVLRSRIFIVLLVSIIIVTLIPALMLSYVYSISVNSMETEIERTNAGVLMQCQIAGENIFSSAESIITDLSFDEYVEQFAIYKGKHSSAGYARIVKSAQSALALGSDVTERNGILELGIYSANSSAVVSLKSGYAHADDYFGISLIFAEDGMFEQLKTESGLGIHTSGSIELYSKNYSGVVASSPVFRNHLRTDDGFVYIVLNDEPLRQILTQITPSESGFACIADADGAVLLQVNGTNHEEAAYTNLDEISVDTADFMVLKSMADSGRQYIAYVPRAVAIERVNYISQTIMTLCIVGGLLVIILAVTLAYRNYKPIAEIINIARNNDTTDVQAKAPMDYDYLRGTVTRLVSSNRNMVDRQEQYMAYSRTDFIHRLSDGSLSLPDEINERAKLLGVDLGAGSYAALLLRRCVPEEDLNGMDSREFNEVSNFWTLVESVFNEMTPFRSLCSRDSLSSMAIVLLMDETEPEECERILTETVRRLAERLHSLYKISLEYICGGITYDVSNIGALFMKADKVERNIETGYTGEVVFPDKIMPENVIDYPVYEESRLIKAISGGQRSSAHQLCTRLIGNNSFLQDVENAKWPEFRQALHLTFDRITENMGCTQAMAEKMAFLSADAHTASLSAFEADIHTLADAIIDVRNAAKQSENAAIMDQMREFIRAHMPDSAFTLYNVSEQFGIPESMLYRFIKENAGMTFAAMLEQYRMENAAKMLRGSDMSIDEIAMQCGYNSSHAFRRVFKKVYNMLPTEYRSNASAEP